MRVTHAAAQLIAAVGLLASPDHPIAGVPHPARRRIRPSQPGAACIDLPARPPWRLPRCWAGTSRTPADPSSSITQRSGQCIRIALALQVPSALNDSRRGEPSKEQRAAPPSLQCHCACIVLAAHRERRCEQIAHTTVAHCACNAPAMQGRMDAPGLNASALCLQCFRMALSQPIEACGDAMGASALRPQCACNALHRCDAS